MVIVRYVVPKGDVTWCVGLCACVCACVYSCCTQASLTDLSYALGLSTVAPPIHHGPSVPPAVIPLPPGTHLLFAQAGKIERLPLEGSTMKKMEAKALLHVPDKVIIGLAFDCVDKVVYWTDISEPSIGRASLHGGEPTTIIRQGGQEGPFFLFGFASSSPSGSWGRVDGSSVCCSQDMATSEGPGPWPQTLPFPAFSEESSEDSSWNHQHLTWDVLLV